MRSGLLILLCVSLISQAQVLRDPDSTPLILRAAGETAAERSVQQAVDALRSEMRTVVNSNLDQASKAQQAEQLLLSDPVLLRQFDEQDDTPEDRTLEEIIDFLERAFYDTAEDYALTDESRETVAENREQRMTEVEPDRPLMMYRPGSDPHAAALTNTAPTDKAQTEIAEPSDIQDSAPPTEQRLSVAALLDDVTVEVLGDAEVTTDLHDDDVVLAELARREGDVVLFDRIHLWAGGAAQIDAYRHEDLLHLDGNGTGKSLDVRRAEIVLRSSYHEQGELKLQYDLAEKLFRDFYWRWQFKDKDYNLTLGQQKEPMGLDYLTGNKFGTAMERSSASSEFSSFRSTGARINRWIDFGERRRVGGFSATRATASIGLFTRDLKLDNANNSDGSLTGRVTLGNAIDGERGLHIGLGGTIRRGTFDSIAPRPEMHIAERILLAEPDADRLVTVAFEAGASFGAIHGQTELFYSDYSGGDVDATGWGGYGQIGWFITGEHREYRPRVGLWAPVNRHGDSAWEAFARVSFTRGEDDVNSANHLAQLAVGLNWYFRQFRASINALYAETDRPVQDFSDGTGLIARVQYLF